MIYLDRNNFKMLMGLHETISVNIYFASFKFASTFTTRVYQNYYHFFINHDSKTHFLNLCSRFELWENEIQSCKKEFKKEKKRMMPVVKEAERFLSHLYNFMTPTSGKKRSTFLFHCFLKFTHNNLVVPT